MTPSFWLWFARFQNWLALMEVQLADPAMLTNTVKNSYLLQLLGEEGQWTFSTEPVVETIAMTMHANFCMAVRNFFYKLTGKVLALYELTMRIQSAGGTIHEYVTELRMLARDCEFGALEKEEIATQLVVGCLNSDAKKTITAKA